MDQFTRIALFIIVASAITIAGTALLPSLLGPAAFVTYISTPTNSQVQLSINAVPGIAPLTASGTFGAPTNTPGLQWTLTNQGPNTAYPSFTISYQGTTLPINYAQGIPVGQSQSGTTAVPAGTAATVTANGVPSIQFTIPQASQPASTATVLINYAALQPGASVPYTNASVTTPTPTPAGAAAYATPSVTPQPTPITVATGGSVQLSGTATTPATGASAGGQAAVSPPSTITVPVTNASVTPVVFFISLLLGLAAGWYVLNKYG